MNQDEFQKYVLDKLECIDKKLIELHERIAKIEENWTWIKRIGWLIIIIISSKLGIDLSNIKI